MRKPIINRIISSGLTLALICSNNVTSMTYGSTPSDLTQPTISEAEVTPEVTYSDTEYAKGEALIMYYDGAVDIHALEKDLNLKKDSSETAVFEDAEISANDTNIQEDISGDIKVSLIKSSKLSTEELVEYLKTNENIIYAEPNYEIQTQSFEPEDLTEFQWALNNNGQFCGTEGADISIDSESVSTEADPDTEKVIALIDTGLDITHPEFQDRLWTNPFSEDVLPGLHGYNFVDDNGIMYDDYGHGTHCAGTMVANINDYEGISGVCGNKNIKIMPLRVISKNTPYNFYANTIFAYSYIYTAMKLGVNIVAVNNSWAIVGSSNILEALINLVGEKGALSVCAAGNDRRNDDEKPVIPACLDSDYIISVAASNDRDEIASFSCYGKETIDIAAPGVNILSSINANSFNPSIYNDEQLNNLTSSYYSFDSGNLVRAANKNTLKAAFENKKPEDIVYSYSMTNSVPVSVTLNSENHFGPKEGNRSLKITLKNAGHYDRFILNIPISLQKSSEDYHIFYQIKPVYKDPTSNNPAYVDNALYNLGGHYHLNEWNTITDTVSSPEDDNIYIYSIVITSFRAGDYDIYIDDFAVSKENVDPNEFGKYEWHSGTSCATPQVTAAVAVVASAYPEISPLELKNALLNNARKHPSFKDKTVSEGVLDLSNLNFEGMRLKNIRLNDNNQIVMTGSYLNGSSVYINDEKKEPLLINDNTIIIDNCSNYINKKIRVKIIKGDSVLEKETMFLKETSYENTAVGSNETPPIEYPIISNGNELFVFLIDYVAIGVVPDNPNEPIVWNRDTAQIDYSLYSNCDRKTIANHYHELRDKMAYFNGNFVVGIPDYSDNHLLTVLAYSP